MSRVKTNDKLIVSAITTLLTVISYRVDINKQAKYDEQLSQDVLSRPRPVENNADVSVE